MRPNPSPALLHPQTYVHPVRVYWEDTDAGGVVFYANYLKFFERARTEWLRQLGFGQHEMTRREGVMFVVAETALRYLKPARLDDLLAVSVTVTEAGRASLLLTQEARCAGVLLAEGRIRIGCVACAPSADGSFRPQRIPTPILTAIQ